MGGRRAKRIGVMGGTFDPIHLAHLVIAEEARTRFQLDEVLFVPSGNPPHKEEGGRLHPESRYLMAVIATAPNPRFRVSRMEIERPGLSYTVDTMREMRRAYGESSEVFFIAGADAVLEISSWKEPEKLLREAAFIVAPRPGHDLEALRKALPVAAEGEALPRVLLMDIPALDISSTDIRARVREGRSISYLVPAGVAAFIEKNGFYR